MLRRCKDEAVCYEQSRTLEPSSRMVCHKEGRCVEASVRCIPNSFGESIARIPEQVQVPSPHLYR